MNVDLQKILTTEKVVSLFGKVYQQATDEFGKVWKVKCPKCGHRALVVSEGLAEGHCFVCFWAVKQLGKKHTTYARTDLPVTESRKVDVTSEFNTFYDIDHPLSTPGKEFIVQRRGILNYKDFSLRYCPVGHFAGRVIIPIYSFGNLIGFQGRTIFDDVEPKYLFSKGFKKSTTLYNFDAARSLDTVVVVEGVVDAMKAAPFAVATFGAGISETQVQLLATYWKVCILLPDDDDAGRVGFTRIFSDLKSLIPTYYLQLTGFHDLGELPMDQVQQIIRLIHQEVQHAT